MHFTLLNVLAPSHDDTDMFNPDMTSNVPHSWIWHEHICIKGTQNTYVKRFWLIWRGYHLQTYTGVANGIGRIFHTHKNEILCFIKAKWLMVKIILWKTPCYLKWSENKSLDKIHIYVDISPKLKQRPLKSRYPKHCRTVNSIRLISYFAIQWKVNAPPTVYQGFAPISHGFNLSLTEMLLPFTVSTWPFISL